MTTKRQERKNNPNYISDDYGPIRSARFVLPPNKRPHSVRNDAEIYGKLGTIDPMDSLSPTGVMNQFAKLGLSASRERNRGPAGMADNQVISSKCKAGKHKYCAGCADSCHKLRTDSAQAAKNLVAMSENGVANKI